MKDFSQLEKKLKVKFKNQLLLKQGFIHRSYLNENPNVGLNHNERLEFLGDAVIELIVTDSLYRSYPEKSEGELTGLRASLVNTKMLSSLADRLEFNDFLLLSRGEAKEQGKSRQYILANTFEAFIGALYLDQGLDKCCEIIKENLMVELPNIIEKRLYKDAKSLFQEEAQDKEKVTPTYKVLEESGPDHAKYFVVGVYLNGKMIARGGGYSKQEAEEETARIALENKGWNK